MGGEVRPHAGNVYPKRMVISQHLIPGTLPTSDRSNVKAQWWCVNGATRLRDGNSSRTLLQSRRLCRLRLPRAGFHIQTLMKHDELTCPPYSSLSHPPHQKVISDPFAGSSLLPCAQRMTNSASIISEPTRQIPGRMMEAPAIACARNELDPFRITERLAVISLRRQNMTYRVERVFQSSGIDTVIDSNW
jgi:hypothetical protein